MCGLPVVKRVTIVIIQMKDGDGDPDEQDGMEWELLGTTESVLVNDGG